MKRVLTTLVLLALSAVGRPARATLLTNGNLDLTHAVEIVPSFFLPKPDDWIAVGIRAASGAYQDELSSEPWAGPAPTPVTADGLLNPPIPDGCGGPDCAVFFKPFTGTPGDEMTAHLYQDVAGTAGFEYALTGWAGAEANLLAAQAVFALDFYSGIGVLLGSATADLYALGLLVPNGEPFRYKQFTVTGIAPPDTAVVRARVSLIDGTFNPAGGGQAFVVDDFTLDATPVPEPATGGLMGLALAWLARQRTRRD